MNKVIIVDLHDRDKLKKFYTIIKSINNKINLYDSHNRNISDLNIYSWLSLQEPLCIEIVAYNGDTSIAYELLKEFEVE